MKKFVFYIVALMSAFSMLAEDLKEDDFEFSHNRFSFSGLLTSSDSYQVEASYHYMFNRYIGIGGGVGQWKVYYEDGWACEDDWEIDNEDNKPSNFYLRPSIVLKSPGVRIKQVSVGIYAEPGVMLNIPYTRVNILQYTAWPRYKYKHISTSKGQWLAVDLRIGLYVNIGPCGFSAGYMMSGFDVYSQYRHLSYRGNSFSNYYPTKSFMQGAYLTASYYF